MQNILGFRFRLRTTGEKEEKILPRYLQRMHPGTRFEPRGIAATLGLQSHVALAFYTSAVKRTGP